MEFDLVTGLMVFGTALATDVLSVLDIRRCTEGKAIQAAILSSAILVLGYVTLATAIHNPLYIGPEALGAAVGTYLTVSLDSRRKVRP